MTASRQYPGVDFPAYLDSGRPDVPFWPPLPAGLSAVPGADTTPIPSSLPADTLRPRYVAELARVCARLLGSTVTAVRWPGGPWHGSCRLTLADGREVIASRRDVAGRARLEAFVLARLRAQGAPVPEPLAFNGLILIQSALPGRRLSDALQDGEPWQPLAAAVESLARVHRCADRAGLAAQVPVLGEHPDWLIALLDRPSVLGAWLGLSTPPLPAEPLFDLLQLVRPRFVKWDARPGNAMLDPDGRVAWFDWEHCGARDPLDDLVWLLCDESLPEGAEDTEDALIAEWLPAFAPERPAEEAHAYLRAQGVLHCCVRLGRLLDVRGEGDWETADRALDKPPGTCRRSVTRLCRRGARWADRNRWLAGLADWFEAVERRLLD